MQFALLEDEERDFLHRTGGDAPTAEQLDVAILPASLRPIKPPRPAHDRLGRSQVPPSRRRRIALVTGNYDTVPDGVSRTLTRLVGYLREHETDVLVVGPLRPTVGDSGRYVTVPSVPIPGRPEYQFTLGLSASARAALAEFRPDVLHVATPDLLGVQAQRWALARDIPVVSSYHTHFPSYLSYYHVGLLQPAVEAYLGWFYRRCRQVYMPTPGLERYARELGLANRIRRWGRGVDCRRFSPRWRSERWRRERGFRPDDVVITFVGRLVKEKRVGVFADVVDVLSEEEDHIRGMVVGDGPLRRRLEQRLPHALFMGHLEGEELAIAYASSDIFLFPSDTEAFGNVVVEAMASGLPIVAAESLATSWHIRHGENGLLAPAGDVDRYRHHTLRLARDADARALMALQGRRDAQAYDWRTILERLVTYYDEVTDGEGRPDGAECGSLPSD